MLRFVPWCFYFNGPLMLQNYDRQSRITPADTCVHHKWRTTSFFLTVCYGVDYNVFIKWLTLSASLSDSLLSINTILVSSTCQVEVAIIKIFINSYAKVRSQRGFAKSSHDLRWIYHDLMWKSFQINRVLKFFIQLGVRFSTDIIRARKAEKDFYLLRPRMARGCFNPQEARWWNGFTKGKKVVFLLS